MMEKPKKERRFLKTLGKIGEILIQEVLLKVGSNLIKRIGGKKTLPSILILFLSISLFAQYPNTGNKQRLGFQTSADGLVWRGSISDTSSIQPVSNQNAWVILDTVNLKIYSFDFSSNVWNQVGTGGGSAFTQPIDSLFFKTSVPPNNVDTAKMRWDNELGTVVLGMYDAVPNELGFKNFWLVKNQTGSTITKGSIVYANGTVGSSGRITVAKFIANGTIDAKYLLGITAHDLTDGEDGYVISFGKIRQVNTDTFAAGAILYPSPTTAGVWTDVEPIAPNIDMPIGFCINSSSNNGTIAIRVASGYSLNELHDVAISSPVDRASLYYRGGLWRDTTTALLVSDTASMLTPYFRDADTTSLNLVSRFAAKQNTLTNPVTGTGTINVLPKFTGTSTLGNSSLFDNGNIGIGTTSPNYLLDLKSITSAKLFLQGGASQNGILFDSIGSINNFYLFNGTLTTSGFGIYDVKNNINRLWIKNDGNVGIGTTSPNSKLDVNGQINTSKLNILGNNQNTILINENIGGTTSGYLIGRSYATNNNQDFFIYDVSTASFKFNINSAGDIGINDATPSFKFDVNGTTGIQGALTVNNATVLNEGSGDFDTRIESDGNANMVFVDASTDRVGIGTNTPSSTLSVNGSVNATDLSLTNPLPITSGGTGAESASVARTTLGVGYTFIESTAGSSVLSNSNRVSLVNTGGGSTTSIDLTTASIGRMYMIKNLASGTVVSDASNVIPFAGGSAGTAILSAGNLVPQWCILIADGTNWHIMQRN